MYLRVSGGHQEAWESYRHKVTGKSTSRRVARWPRDRTLEQEIQATLAAWSAVRAKLVGRDDAPADLRLRWAKLELRYVALSRAVAAFQQPPWPLEQRRRFEQPLIDLEQHAEELLIILAGEQDVYPELPPPTAAERAATRQAARLFAKRRDRLDPLPPPPAVPGAS
jgi:hypothetical protein